MSKRYGLLIVIMCLSMALTGCDALLPLNTTTPDYIKDVAAYKEGSEGLIVYCILADATGAMTTAPGEVTLRIVSDDTAQRQSTGDIYYRSITVAKSAFHKTTVGQGHFERSVTLLSFGRIPYSAFVRPPSALSGTIEVTFVTQDGRKLTGNTTIFF